MSKDEEDLIVEQKEDREQVDEEELIDDMEYDDDEFDDEEFVNEITSKNQKRTRIKFAQRLNEIVSKYSKCVMRPGGNVTVAVVNYDFCYEFTDLFIETLCQVLLNNEKMYFDQFGKFEVRTRPARVMNNMLTGFKDKLVPEYRVINFQPCKRFKERMRGVKLGRVRKKFFTKGCVCDEMIYSPEEQKIIDSEANKNGN